MKKINKKSIIPLALSIAIILTGCAKKEKNNVISDNDIQTQYETNDIYSENYEEEIITDTTKEEQTNNNELEDNELNIEETEQKQEEDNEIVPDSELNLPLTESTETLETILYFEDTNTFAYINNNATIYEDEKCTKPISEIESYQKVLSLKSNTDVDYVQTEDLTMGYIKTNDITYMNDVYVEVDISDQTIKIYKENELILTSLVVTGADRTPTRIGYFPIMYKAYDTYLKGPGYNCHVNYWMPFDGGIGLHDASWRSTFGGDIHFENGSHGCVNMPNETAKIVDENVKSGDYVLVHK